MNRRKADKAIEQGWREERPWDYRPLRRNRLFTIIGCVIGMICMALMLLPPIALFIVRLVERFAG